MKKELKHPYNVFFGTLANQTRLDIIMLLMKGEHNVTQIYTKLGYNQPTISKSLARLEHCGFVFCEHRGKQCYYTLNKNTIKPLVSLMKKHMGQYCSKIHCNEQP